GISNQIVFLFLWPPGNRVVKCLSRMMRKYHVRFLEEGGEVTLLPYSANIRIIDKMLPVLIEYDEKKKSEKTKDRVIQIIILIFVALFSVGAGYFLSKF
ncbi:MAG: hypothetical protein Q7V05_09540, partial [Methanoregula sp.]|nr:hypothetical protein [Methanoregula sp.]